MVDGVKCFATDINGAAIPSTTLLGYQAEGARTNLCLQSQDFGTTWINVNSTETVNQVAAPDGTTTGDLFTASAGAGQHSIAQDTAWVSGSTYAFSVYAKKGTNNFIALTQNDGGTEYASKVFDLNTGTLGESSVSAGDTLVSSSITSVGNGWYRCEIVATVTCVASNRYSQVAFATAATGNTFDTAGRPTFNAAGTETVYLWGAQVELGSFASSYIPTTTIAVARNADVLTYTGGDIPNLKTLMAGFRREVGVGSAGAIAQLDDGTANDFVITYLSSATAIRHQGTDGGAVQWNLPVAAVSTYVPGTACKSVQTWTTNDVKAAVNGATLTGDTAATVPTVTQLTVGHLLGALQLDGNVGPIYGWTRNQSQSELNAVTQ